MNTSAIPEVRRPVIGRLEVRLPWREGGTGRPDAACRSIASYYSGDLFVLANFRAALPRRRP